MAANPIVSAEYLAYFLLLIVGFLSSLTFNFAIPLRYCCPSNYSKYTLFIVLLNTYVEFTGASVCFCYGLTEGDLFLTTVGLLSISTGIYLRGFLRYQQKRPQGKGIRKFTILYSHMYILCVVFSSSEAYWLINIGTPRMQPGDIKLAAWIVFPLVGLSGRLGSDRGELEKELKLLTLWFGSFHAFIMYFFGVTIVFDGLQFLVQEIEKAVSFDDMENVYASDAFEKFFRSVEGT